MALPQLPDETVVSELVSHGNVDSALELYASVLIKSSDSKSQALRCREYVELPVNSVILQNSLLRKAVFHAIFNLNLLRDSSIETYWDIISHYGPSNYEKCCDYLKAAPHSVPLKLGRLLLYKSEFGSQLPEKQFRAVLTIFFSVPKIVETVITESWLQKLKKNRGINHETAVLIELADEFQPQGPIHSLCTLFPDLSPMKAAAVMKKSQISLEDITQNILDDPNYVENMLSPTQGQKKSRREYISMEERKKRKEEKIKQDSKKFVYKYVPLEDMDPEPEEAELGLEPDYFSKRIAAEESMLQAWWDQNRYVFLPENRNSSGRSILRSQLKHGESEWTDEQIEAWAANKGPIKERKEPKEKKDQNDQKGQNDQKKASNAKDQPKDRSKDRSKEKHSKHDPKERNRKPKKRIE